MIKTAFKICFGIALQPEMWGILFQTIRHTLGVTWRVWQKRQVFAELGVSPWHVLQAAMLHDLGKPVVAEYVLHAGVWAYPDHEVVIADRIKGSVHDDVWRIVRYHELPQKLGFLDRARFLKALSDRGLDCRWAKILWVFAQCDQEHKSDQDKEKLFWFAFMACSEEPGQSDD